MAQRTEKDFKEFTKRLKSEVMNHRIICENKYTRWFQGADLSVDEVRHFTVQFSVFSNFFIVAQLKKVINAPTIEEMRASKEILLNELGVVFRPHMKEDAASVSQRKDNAETEGDPELVNVEGTVEGGTFHFQAAHFEWLIRFASPLGLTFNDIGKHWHGSPSTLHFIRGLEKWYASEDMSTSAGASYAIENWAAAGFWKELIAGLTRFKEVKMPELHLGFWTWHDKVEDQHAAHTQDELKHIYFDESFDDDKFIEAGNRILDDCAVFWDGLYEDHLKHDGNDKPAPGKGREWNIGHGA